MHVYFFYIGNNFSYCYFNYIFAFIFISFRDIIDLAHKFRIKRFRVTTFRVLR